VCQPRETALATHAAVAVATTMKEHSLYSAKATRHLIKRFELNPVRAHGVLGRLS
jgi:hypothetical protein